MSGTFRVSGTINEFEERVLKIKKTIEISVIPTFMAAGIAIGVFLKDVPLVIYAGYLFASLELVILSLHLYEIITYFAD